MFRLRQHQQALLLLLKQLVNGWGIPQISLQQQHVSVREGAAIEQTAQNQACM